MSDGSDRDLIYFLLVDDDVLDGRNTLTVWGCHAIVIGYGINADAPMNKGILRLKMQFRPVGVVVHRRTFVFHFFEHVYVFRGYRTCEMSIISFIKHSV